jgi:hypothetical protein
LDPSGFTWPSFCLLGTRMIASADLRDMVFL